MKLFVTSCNRPDLLKRTLESFFLNQKYPISQVVIHEDAKGYLNSEYLDFKHGMEKLCPCPVEIIFTNGIGQHASIEKFLNECEDEFAVMCEDDWEFDNTYDWIDTSFFYMKSIGSKEYKPIGPPPINVIKTLCRKNSPHVNKKYSARVQTEIGDIYINFLKTWLNNGIFWEGFSWNPGVTDLNALRKMIPFPKYEQDLGDKINKSGYEVAELEKGIYTHIGDGRSTHD